MYPSPDGAPRLGHSISLETLGFRDGGTKSEAFNADQEIASTSTLPLIKNPAFLHPQEYTPEHIPARSTRNSQRKCSSICPYKMPTGWRFGTTGAATFTLIILIINVAVTIVCAKQKGGVTESIASIRTGECTSIKKLGIGVHLVINIVSTLLLGASNYCMQTISAPTRDEINKAHARGSWMDIGIPSLRNLRFIQKRRLFVWLCLGVSSIPLHLVYNSTFFVSTTNNMYRIWFADESFANGASFNETFFNKTWQQNVNPWKLQNELKQGDRYQILTNDECIRSYAKNLIEDKGNLVLVVDRPKNCSIFEHSPNGYLEAYNITEINCGNTSATSLYGLMDYDTRFQPNSDPLITNWFSWICSQDDTYASPVSFNGVKVRPKELCSDGAWKNEIGADPWMVSGARVRYCLSEKITSQCQLKVAINLLGVVIAFNIAKLIIIVTLARGDLISHEPIVTIGDAAASFIESPDPTTRGMCLKTGLDLRGKKSFQAIPATVYQPQDSRWSAAVSKVRWIVASALTLIALVAIIGLLGYASRMLNSLYDRGDIKSLWAFGLGAISPFTIIQGWAVPTNGTSAVVGTVLLANLPQVLLSFWYLILNGAVTSMAAAAEWSRFAQHDHRPLRVSFPKRYQRSTYFLQLPYRYSIPMMVFSVLIHWLVSQSIFITQIFERSLWMSDDRTIMGPDNLTSEVITTGAFSPMGMVLTIIVVAVVFAAIIFLGRRRLRSSMPLAGSCSLAISAACHAPKGTSHLLPVKWGVVGSVDAGLEGIAHCSFSNDNVELLQPGKLYA